MVLPLAGAGAGLATMGPPTDELLRMRPLLRRYVLLLGVITLAELAAPAPRGVYRDAALRDVCTVMFGAMLLCRGLQGLVRGLPAFTLLSALNFLFQALTLFQFLAGAPGPGYFFAPECLVTVKRPHDGGWVSQRLNLCSWRTVFGNVALCCGVLLEFQCARLGWKMFSSMREAATSSMASAMAPMMELEESFPGAGPFSRRDGAGDLEGQAREVGGLLARPPPAFSPFVGQPHRLADD